MNALLLGLVAAAALLAVTPTVRLPAAADRAGPRTLLPARTGLTGLGALVVGALLVLEGNELALAMIATVALAAGWALWRGRRRAEEAERTRATVVELAEALAGELRAGQPAVTALVHGADLWPAIGPVVAAARLDADVPGALREVAARPGAEALADVAAAWEVSVRSGAALAGALGQVAASARARQQARRVVASELSSARATARLVAVLPVAVLVLTSGFGGAPWQFLLGHPVGIACLGLGVLLLLGGLLWIDRIAAAALEE